MRISYSSSNLFQGCQRRFYLEKVAKVEPDPDYNDDATALRLGKGFHTVLELCEHEKSMLKKSHIAKAWADNDIESESEKGLILGMVKKYFDLHGKSGLTVVGTEMKIGDEDIVGYVDAVMVDESGYWYIVDLKTAARLNGSLLSRLSKDPQLNIYSYYRQQIADEYNLDVNLFAGIRYRVTTKANIKMNRETFAEFIKRVYDRVESYDIPIPADELIPDVIYRHFMKLLQQIRELETTPENEVAQNFTYCETYFKPCPYWSRCYGRTFTAAAAQHQVFTSLNMPTIINDDGLDLL